jgi:hypothetical protein
MDELGRKYVETRDDGIALTEFNLLSELQHTFGIRVALGRKADCILLQHKDSHPFHRPLCQERFR